jgi:DNA polymerase-3 subunit beta
MLEQNFEITIERSVFVKALSHLNSLVERKNTIGILSHLKIEAADGQLVLTTTDGSLSMTETIFAEVIQSGSITLPAHLLYDIVRKFSDEKIQLKIDEIQTSMVEISAGYSVFHLPFLLAEEFPHIDIGKFDCKFNLSNEAVTRIIEKNRYTIAQEDARYHLNGIYIHPILESNELRATATDGHRLSSTIIPLPDSARTMPGIIIPRKAIFELLKIVSDSNQEVVIEVSNLKARFTIGNIVIVTKLIEASFPDYIPLIPYDNSLYFNLPSADLSRALDRATIIMTDKSQAVTFCISKEQLEITTGGENQSSANEKLEINSNIEQLNSSLNARYIIDALMAIGNGSNVELRFKNDISSILIQSTEDKKTDFVIMPMRA